MSYSFNGSYLRMWKDLASSKGINVSLPIYRPPIMSRALWL